MEQYHTLLEYILGNGEDVQDRTGVGTRRVFGRMIDFDLREGFPAVTTKRLAWKCVVGELLWFLEGNSNERRLAEITYGTRDPKRTTIWTGNAQADYWQDRAAFPGDLGRVYGTQWRDWDGVDQIQTLVDGLKNDPYSRRHILSAWNVGELNRMALPPCHVMSQYYVSGDGRLSCHMYQRSVDTFLGLPFNIASYALLTHMLAQVTDLKVGNLVISMGDTHVYLNHLDQVREQLSRDERPLPSLHLTPGIKDITMFTMDDIKLVGYDPHGPIQAEMAV